MAGSWAPVVTAAVTGQVAGTVVTMAATSVLRRRASVHAAELAEREQTKRALENLRGQFESLSLALAELKGVVIGRRAADVPAGGEHG